MSTFAITYPKGGTNKFHEPLDIKANIGLSTKMIVQMRTFTRDGCQFYLFYDGMMMSNRSYFRSFGCPSPAHKLARELADDMNIVNRLEDIDGYFTSEALLPIVMESFKKCESRYGNKLRDAEYEVQITFE